MIDCGSRLLKILTKHFLNAAAINCGLVNVTLFSIAAEGIEFNHFLKDVRFLIHLQVFFRSLILV